jgi:hypothetical protein
VGHEGGFVPDVLHHDQDVDDRLGCQPWHDVLPMCSTRSAEGPSAARTLVRMTS